MAMIMQADPAAMVAGRVCLGAQLLDIRTPSWAGRVQQSRLDMASTRDDVLGQVYHDDNEPAGNGYSWAVTQLRDKLGEEDFLGEPPVNDWLERHGFKADPFLITREYTEADQYQDMRVAWLHELEARRHGRATASQEHQGQGQAAGSEDQREGQRPAA